MIRHIIIILSVTFVWFLHSCDDNENIQIPEEIENLEILTQEEVAAFEEMEEITNFTTETVISPDGRTLKEYMLATDSLFYNQWRDDAYENLTPQQAKVLLLNRMQLIALYLTDRSKHQPESEGEDAPAQNGLAYTLGGKDYTVRKAATAGECRNKRLYGLDCSGFVYQLFTKAGVPSFKKGQANDQIKVEHIENAIGQDIPVLSNIEVEDLGKISISEFQPGDLVYWHKNGKAYHIAIVLKDSNGQTAIFNSNGTGDSKNNCEGNYGLKRGPRRLQASSEFWFKKREYSVVRINLCRQDLCTLTDTSSKEWRLTKFISNGNDITSDFIYYQYIFRVDGSYWKESRFIGGSPVTSEGVFEFTDDDQFFLNSNTNLYNYTLTEQYFKITKADNNLFYLEFEPI